MPASLSDHLHLGCGLTAPEGWLNVDASWQVVLARHPFVKELLVRLRLFPRSQASIKWNANVIRLDLRRRLPFPDDTFHAIYSSHTLEHLYYEDVGRLLAECRRVLKPGGVCRVVVPDLAATVERYAKAKQAGERRAANRFMEELLVHDKQRKRGLLGLYYRLTAYHQHKWMYDAESMRALFEQAGFEHVSSVEYCVSRIERIKEVEDPGRILGGQGVAVEGLKS